MSLKSVVYTSLLCLSLMTLSGCSRTQTVYVKEPLIVPTELTEQVKPDVYQPGEDLVPYALRLLLLIDQMNIDRYSVYKAIEAHNSTE